MARHKIDKKRPDIRTALDLGWQFVGFTGGAHLRFEHPDCAFKMVLSNSASDYRAHRNAIAWARRNTPLPRENE